MEYHDAIVVVSTSQPHEGYRAVIGTELAALLLAGRLIFDFFAKKWYEVLLVPEIMLADFFGWHLCHI